MPIAKFRIVLLASVASLSLTTLRPMQAYGQTVSDRILSDVTTQSVGDCVTVAVRFQGRVQLLSSFPENRGQQLSIRVRLLDNTGIAGRESLRTPAGVPALRSIEFDGDAADGPSLSLLFKRDMQFNVSAGLDPDTINISLSEVGRNAVCSAWQAGFGDAIPTVEQDAPLVPPVQTTSAPSETATIPAGLYVINLLSQPTAIGDVANDKLSKLSDRVLYRNSFERDGQQWFRLRAGFFATREEAEKARQAVLVDFPDAWIVKVAAAEREQGVGTRLVLSDMPAAPTAPVAARELAVDEKTAIDAIVADAEAAIKADDYDRAIQLLTKGVSYPENPQTPRMLELLGLMRERKNQKAQARAEYEEYLRRYPSGDGTDRVKQRLAGLDVPADSATGQVLRDPTGRVKASSQGWKWGARGSFSQFYFRDQSQTKFVTAPLTPNDPNRDPVIDDAVNVNQLLTTADLTVTGGNDRTSYLIRGSGSYTKSFRAKTKLVDPVTGAISFRSGDVKTVSALYFDATDNETKLSARIGRQTRNGAGVLGRFDGGLIGFQASKKIRLSVVGGTPVLRARDLFVRSDRFFYGASVDIGGKRDTIQSTLYWYDERSPGFIDRQAVGAELRFAKDKFNMYTMIDYDVHYNRLNLGLISLNYFLPDESNISVTADYRQSPLLNTWNVVNGLFGQTLPGQVLPVDELSDLKGVFTDNQVYRLAADNTIVAKSMTVSYSRPITKKLQANIDFTMNNTGGAPGSTQVFPGSTLIAPTIATGTEYYYGAQLVGSGLIFENDIYIIGGRYADTPRSRSYTADINARIPVTPKFRLNPRARYGYRDDRLVQGSYRQIQPSLRMNYYPFKHSEVEFEIGANFNKQKSTMGGVPSTTTEQGILFSLGYRMDF
jgi:tetratricopeptide (TPR) repeat protein